MGVRNWLWWGKEIQSSGVPSAEEERKRWRAVMEKQRENLLLPIQADGVLT